MKIARGKEKEGKERSKWRELGLVVEEKRGKEVRGIKLWGYRQRGMGNMGCQQRGMSCECRSSWITGYVQP